MKAKYALVLLAIGFCCDFVGALFKIQHWPYASELLITGMACKVLGVLLFGMKLLSHPKTKDFMNR